MNKRKLFIVLILLFVLLLSNSCNKKENTDMKGITNLVQDEMFSQSDDKYYIFFYRDNCNNCEKAKPYVLDYIKRLETEDGLLPIYGVNLSNEKNKILYRAYGKNNGQGTGETCEGLFYVNGVTKWENLYIGCTASLIKIYTSNGIKTAHFVVNGSDDIQNELQK